MYNYLEEVRNDVFDYINEHYTQEEQLENLANRDEWEASLLDELWCCDYVTGNGSGSYTFNSYKAEEYLCHNLELLKEALMEFGCDITYLENGAEACDVTIRCYLLGSAINEALDIIEEELEEE